MGPEPGIRGQGSDSFHGQSNVVVQTEALDAVVAVRVVPRRSKNGETIEELALGNLQSRRWEVSSRKAKQKMGWGPGAFNVWTSLRRASTTKKNKGGHPK